MGVKTIGLNEYLVPGRWVKNYIMEGRVKPSHCIKDVWPMACAAGIAVSATSCHY